MRKRSVEEEIRLLKGDLYNRKRKYQVFFLLLFILYLIAPIFKIHEFFGEEIITNFFGDKLWDYYLSGFLILISVALVMIPRKKISDRRDKKVLKDEYKIIV